MELGAARGGRHAYTIVAGNPAALIRRRFDDEMIALLSEWKWWDKPVEEIDVLIPVLTSGKLDDVKEWIKEEIGKGGGDHLAPVTAEANF